MSEVYVGDKTATREGNTAARARADEEADEEAAHRFLWGPCVGGFR